MNVSSGIVAPTFLAGVVLAEGMAAPKISTAFAETSDDQFDTTPTIDLARGWETSTVGAPMVIRKWRFSLAWDRVTQTDALTFLRVRKRRGTSLLCVFKPIVELFKGDGVKTYFKLSAGIAVQPSGSAGSPGQIPAALGYAYASFATEVTRNGVTEVVTFDSSLDANGRHGLTLSTALLAGETLRVFYVPVFTCRCQTGQPKFTRPFLDGLTLELEAL